MTKEEKAAQRAEEKAAQKRRREEKIRAKANAKAKDEAKNGKIPFYKRWWRGIIKWFRDMRSELKKVVWPTPKQLLNNSLVALAVMAAAAVVTYGVDQLASGFVYLLTLIGG